MHNRVKRTIERYKRIDAYVRRLYEMDLLGISGDEEYKSIEDRIRTDLFELTNPSVEDVMSRFPPKTGIMGVNRDNLSFL